MKSTYKWGAVAFGISLVSTIVYGQARTPYTRPAYITTPGTVTAGSVVSNGSFNSTVASGNQAFTCTNVGCRLSLGNTSRFIFDDSGNGVARFEGWGVSTSGNIFTQNGGVNATSGNPINVSGATADGATAVATILRSQSTFSTAGSKITSFRNNTSEVSFIDYLGNYSGNGFVATTASGATLRGGGASGPMLIEPTTADSHTSSTVPALLIKPANAITAGDALLIVQNSAGTQRFRIRDDGNTFASQFIARYHFGDQTPVEIGTYMTPGTEKNPIQLTAVGNFTADDVNLVSIRNNTSTLVSAFSKDGLLRVNASNAAKPTCNATNRGRVFYLDGAAGAADTYEICMKNAADAYAWKTIVTP